MSGQSENPSVTIDKAAGMGYVALTDNEVARTVDLSEASGDLVMVDLDSRGDDKPCPCWTQPCGHEGHCCMDHDDPCHRDEGLAIWRRVQEGPSEATGADLTAKHPHTGTRTTTTELQGCNRPTAKPAAG